MAGDQAQLDRLAERFRLFVATDCNRYTPLYARLGSAVAEDPELLALLAKAAPGQQRPVLFLAAVHDLVLAEPDAPLARFYPSVTDSAVPDDDPVPELRRFCMIHHDALVDRIAHRSTQTNEVNRSVALRAALGAAVADVPHRPLALLELGASAGLNLAFDRYTLPGVFGPEPPVVSLQCEVVGDRRAPFDRPLPDIEWKAGLDRHPISIDDPDGIRWIEACLWPEQLERIERFRAAVAAARAADTWPTIVVGDMVDDLAMVAAGAPPDAHLVVWHSWVLTYLGRALRPAFADAVASLGAGSRPATWLSAEAPGVVASLEAPTYPTDAPEEERFATLVGMERFRDGTSQGGQELLARCHPHLRWLEWLA